MQMWGEGGETTFPPPPPAFHSSSIITLPNPHPGMEPYKNYYPGDRVVTVQSDFFSQRRSTYFSPLNLSASNTVKGKHFKHFALCMQMGPFGPDGSVARYLKSADQKNKIKIDWRVDTVSMLMSCLGHLHSLLVFPMERWWPQIRAERKSRSVKDVFFVLIGKCYPFRTFQTCFERHRGVRVCSPEYPPSNCRLVRKFVII